MRFIRLSPHLCAAAGRRDLRENEMHPTSNEHQGLSVTRRRFLRSGALTAAIVPTLSVWNLPAAAADVIGLGISEPKQVLVFDQI
jgi:hypothetical protein